jgi:hypothetical protein
MKNDTVFLTKGISSVTTLTGSAGPFGSTCNIRTTKHVLLVRQARTDLFLAKI